MTSFDKNNSRSKSKHHLNEETIQYYRRVTDTLEEGFPSDFEKGLFLNNVFTQLSDEAISVCQCHLTSHIVEDLVKVATPENLKTLLTIFSEDWDKVIGDKCASHVLQQCLFKLPKYVSEALLTYKAAETDTEAERSLEEDLIQVVMGLSSHIAGVLEDCLTHIYKSHILRALLQFLGGTCVGDNIMKSRASRDGNRKGGPQVKEEATFENFEIPKFCKKTIKRFIKQIFGFESFNLYLMDQNANPVIQTLLLIMKKVDPDRCQKYLLKVIKRSRIEEVGSSEGAGTVKLPPVAADSIGSYLVEQVVKLASDDIYTELFNKIFKGRLLSFAIHRSANFVLQNFIRSCPNKELFGEIFDEIGPCLEDSLAINNFGVTVAVAETCLRLQSQQDNFIQLLMKVFHCVEPVERQIKLVPLLTTFKTYEMLYPEGNQSQQSDQSRVNYHGSLLLQKLLQYKHTNIVVDSMLDLEPVQLRALSCDSCGSHVIDAFFNSSAVGQKGKDTLLDKMKILYIEMACNSSGSRILETIWKCINTKQKVVIATELCKQENKVQSDRFGRHIHRNFALRLFVTRRQDWQQFQGSDQKKRKMFQDFITPDKDSNKKQKRQEGGNSNFVKSEDPSKLPEIHGQLDRMFPKYSQGKQNKAHKYKNKR